MVTPNWSLRPGSPLSSTITLNVHSGSNWLQVPEKRTVFAVPSLLRASTSTSVTSPLAWMCGAITWFT